MLAAMPQIIGTMCRGHRRPAVNQDPAVEANQRYDEITIVMTPFLASRHEDRVAPTWKITVSGVPGNGWTVKVDADDLARIYKNLQNIGVSLGSVALNRIF